MMKRIIALLLALILTVGLLPTVALAAEGTAGPIASVTGNDSSGNVHVKKEIYQNDDGTYKVRLESWATGTQTIVEKHLPMDIVLVLDVSGSMKTKDVVSSADTPTQVGENEKNESLRSKAAANNLFVQVDGNYYPVTVQRNPNRQGLNTEYTYSYTKDGSTVNLGTYKGSNRTYSNSNMPLYSVQSNNYITRLDALKNAVNAFIEKVATDATKNKVDHKISIVKFAGTELTNKNGDDMYWVGQDHRNNTQIVKELTSANVTSNVTALQAAVNALNYGGATQADFGMNRAAAALGSFTSEDVKTRGRIVIMFTDGVPTDYQDYDNGVAGNAVAKARELKDKGAKVYTIAMIGSANPSDTSRNINRYMNGVSSNYPQATKCDSGYYIDHWYHYGVDLGTRGDGSYYQAASSSADSLKKIFDAISKDISNNTTALDESAILFDELPENFEIPANAQNITTKTADYTGENTWGADTTVTNLRIKPKNNNTLFEITGFNYADNWCGKRTDNSYGGKKLIVEFNIQHDNYGGTQPTNKSAGISNEEEEDALVIVPNPSIAVPIAIPSITVPSATKVYDGTGIDVLENVAVEADKLVTGENEGKNAFVDIIVKVKDANNVEYTYTIPAGATKGSWDKENVEFKTPADVKIESDGSVGKYSYDLSITYQDKSQTNPADTKTVTGKAEYTITKRPVTLTSASGEKKWDGTALTNDTVTVSAGEGNTVGGFVTGEGATYDVTGSQTNVGSSDNTFTYTLNEGTKDTNYEITQKTGTLTVKPIDQEVVITIKGQIVTATYDGGEKTASGYTVTVPEGVDANKITVTVAEGKMVPSVSATDATTTALVQTITADMFTVTSPYKKVTINCENGSLTINPRKVKMVSGTASKPYDGTALTNSTVTDSGFEGYDGFVNGEGATYSVTGTITDPGEVDNAFTYTLNSNTKASNYDITQECGKLTITGSKTYTITFTTEAGGTLTGKTEYTDLAYNAVFPTEPEKVANTGYYFDGWYKNNTKVTSFPEKVTENATYTAKWLSYNSINLDLTGKIQKTLYSDVELSNQRFTINVKQTGAEVASATATATVSATTASGTGYTGSAPFQTATDEFKLTFTAPGIYNYSIVEEDGQLAGMTYDVNKPTDGHKLTVNVTADDTTHALSFESVTVDGTSIADVTVATTWLTITNNYVEPKNAQVTNKEVVVTQPEGALKTAVYAFETTSEVTVLYPTGNGTTSNTLEVPYGTTAATLLYKITVYAGTKTYYEFDDVGAELVYAEHANVVQENNTFKVTFEDGAEYAYVYVAVTHGLNFDDDSCKVDNTVLGQTAKTTVKEKDPNSVTVDFSQLVYKKLTVTGDKAFTGATFEAVLDGEWHDLPAALSLEDASAIATYAHATPGAAQLHKTLTVSFDANDDLTQNKAFTGSITFNAEGVYTYTLKEIIPEGATGYDTSEFHLVVTVEANGNGQLEATVSMWFNDELMPLETGILFSNTIDTGKDDYYPIIIPTIINKDTGMLNKTDHFAYVIGYPDGTVHPNGQITRAEVATIFFRLLRDEVRDGAFTTSNSYSDVAYGKWYNNPISTMSALGIITGYPDGTFKPNKPITRAEFAAIAARFDETQSGKSATFSDVIGHWAAKEIGIAYYNDWIKGYPDGTFKPDQNITRAEAMTLINRVLERKPESPADLLTNMNKWTDNLDTSKWYYLDVQEATNSHGYTRKTFNYELWRQMLPDPDWSRYER